MRVFRYVTFACLIIIGVLLPTAKLGAITTFESNVSTAIDRGIEWLANQGVFANPSNAGDAAGLAMEALLEKRASGNPGDPPQGYSGASPTDQARLRNIASYILDRAAETPSFYAYRDGNYAFALASYALTGGPDKSNAGMHPGDADYQTIKEAMDTLVGRILNFQHTSVANGSGGPYAAADQGYWCYGPGGGGGTSNCDDSSTTQFAAAGLAAAKSFYSSALSGDQAFADGPKVTAINTALGLAKTAYELNAKQGSDNASCNVLTASERGAGYQGGPGGNVPTLQQTASGVYIQLFGGSNVNTPSVQNYIQWLRNRYRWQDLDNLGSSWTGLSWSYYMWSSFKGMELIRQSGIAPSPGNLGPNDLGTLPAASAPACPVRQDHKNPAAVTQPASFGGAAAGVYSGEPVSQYFDYAHEIISKQCYDGAAPINGNDGNFQCNGTQGAWETYSHQSYLLLVLQRAVGGACVDSDGDTVCDAVDNCPTVANPGQENTFGGPAGDACEAPPSLKLNVATAPAAGTAGVSTVGVTGALWPAGAYTAGQINIFFATGSCFAATNQVSTTGTALTTIAGSTRRVTVRIPATATAGLNYVWIVGPGFQSAGCSQITVIAPPT